MLYNHKSFYNFGGISFISAGILFFVKYLLTLPVPNPPSDGVELLRWLHDWNFNMAMSNEIFFFAVICLVPSFFVLYRILVNRDKIKAMFGCGIIAVIIPVLAMLDIVQGRLVYPVYNITLSPDVLKLVLSIYYGGLHATSLLIGLATIVLSLVMRRSIFGIFIAYFGFVTGLFDFIGAYPWLIGSVFEFVSQFLFSSWFMIIGIRIISTPKEKIELILNNL